VAISHGFHTGAPSEANYWSFENLDNAQTGIHDHGMFRKYGFGRLCQQISVDVRRGLISRDMALDIVRANDGRFPARYAGVLGRRGSQGPRSRRGLGSRSTWTPTPTGRCSPASMGRCARS
jgi:hypothetical protein